MKYLILLALVMQEREIALAALEMMLILSHHPPPNYPAMMETIISEEVLTPLLKP
ncbi:MAG: hypothetical protein M0Q53_22070 [Prolixibacteraceae bacterium]|jgi:hypothetical protein|nr:hypothetical protein [Prolixibacteraceae bacterium]